MNFVSRYLIESARFDIVVVDETGQEYGAAPLFLGSVKGHAAVIEEAVGPGADDRVGGRRKGLQRGCRSDGRIILGKTGNEVRSPGLSSVEDL